MKKILVLLLSLIVCKIAYSQDISLLIKNAKENIASNQTIIKELFVAFSEDKTTQNIAKYTITLINQKKYFVNIANSKECTPIINICYVCPLIKIAEKDKYSKREFFITDKFMEKDFYKSFSFENTLHSGLYEVSIRFKDNSSGACAVVISSSK